MITVEKIEENLINLIGKPFNENDVICAFEDFEENGESKVYLIICQTVMLLLLLIQKIVNIGSTLQHRFILQIKTSV